MEGASSGVTETDGVFPIGLMLSSSQVCVFTYRIWIIFAHAHRCLPSFFYTGLY